MEVGPPFYISCHPKRLFQHCQGQSGVRRETGKE
jgi:hypothetical protein